MPTPERLAPRKVKEGTLDLTAAVLFARNSNNLHGDVAKLCELVKRELDGPFGKLSFSSVISMLLKHITPFTTSV